MNFSGVKDHILRRLKDELKPTLYYHSAEHTVDVLDATRRLNEAEKVDEKSAVLNETAALFHDTGILFQYFNHETASVGLAKEILPRFDYNTDEIDYICGLIMVTRLPQRPLSRDEQILCDADLDYLGREDYFIHSFQLRLEWQSLGVNTMNLTEWFHAQVSFLSEHKYHTQSAFLARNEQKMKNLEEVKQLINHCKS